MRNCNDYFKQYFTTYDLLFFLSFKSAGRGVDLVLLAGRLNQDISQFTLGIAQLKHFKYLFALLNVLLDLALVGRHSRLTNRPLHWGLLIQLTLVRVRFFRFIRF